MLTNPFRVFFASKDYSPAVFVEGFLADSHGLPTGLQGTLPSI